MERLHELSGYIPNWESKPRPQVVEEIASWSLETKRLPDPYYFLIREDGKLLSPQTGKLVEDSVEKTSYLGQREFGALDQIQKWDKEGLSFWISAPHPQRSGFTKIVVSEIQIEGSQKRLFNRALLLDLDTNGSIDLARNLALIGNAQVVLDTAEDLRSNPIFINVEGFNWIDFLDLNMDDKHIFELIRSGDDITQKEIALEKSGIIYEELFAKNNTGGYDDDRIKRAVEKAQELNVFGNLPGSCPPALMLQQQKDSAFTEFFKNAEKSFPCPECHRPIPSGEGITKCPHCGITKEEYGSKCD